MSFAPRPGSRSSSTAPSRSGRSRWTPAGLDFLTVSGQKWLCGPDSTGALVVADPERLRISAPTFLSKVDNDSDGAFRPRPGAARFDPLVARPVPRRPARGARGTARVGVRARGSRRRALPGAAEPTRGGDRPGEPRHARRVPSAGRSGRARGRPPPRGRSRPRDPGNRSRAGLVRLVDVRRGSRAPRGGSHRREEGACPCGAVRYTVRGPVRDIIVCHCEACRRATGGPWAASAAGRDDLVVTGEAFLAWETRGGIRARRLPRSLSALRHHRLLGRVRERDRVVCRLDAPGRSRSADRRADLDAARATTETRPTRPASRSPSPSAGATDVGDYAVGTGSPSSPRSAAGRWTTFAMCASSSSPRSSAPA